MPTPLLPQYTLRRLLGVITLAALFFAVVAWGVRGSHWAAAVSIGGLALVVLLAVHTLLFVVVWGVAGVLRRRRPPMASPFRKIS